MVEVGVGSLLSGQGESTEWLRPGGLRVFFVFASGPSTSTGQ